MALHVGIDPMFTLTDDDDEKHPDSFNGTDDLDHEEHSIISNLSDSGTEDDDSVFRFDKKSSSYGSARRFFNKSSSKTFKGNKRSSTEDTSKEFLTLQFYDEDKARSDTEKVAAKKGKSIKESIESLLHERDIDFSTHSVFLESSKTPLPLAFDAFPLGGNVLHVKENQMMHVDERIITLMKSAEDDKRVQNQRPKKNLMSSIFNDDVEVSTVNNKHQSLTRKSGVASGVTKDDNQTLSDLLNHYTFNYFDTENDMDGYENSLEDTYLEESWTDVITEYEGMTSKDKIQQETIWELLITERNYLRKLRVIIMVFKNCLVSLQKEKFLEDVDINKLFANIKEVYDTNHKFWGKHLKYVTEEARATKQPIKPSQLHESFALFEELFQPYIKYCMEEGACMKYLKQLKRENEMFQEYLAWCENHRQCMRLKLADLFVKPMQRVTKYALLLKAILGKTSDKDEKTSLENMIMRVDRFVTKINTTLRLRNEQQKLDDVLERIETYNPIEAANEEMEKLLLESQYCNFDLHGNIPGLPEEEQRCILLDGPMKMIEKQGRNDIHVFLFTDVLVLAKAKKGSDKFRIIRQPYRLNKIMLHRSKDVGAFLFVYLNEYGVVVTAFTLQAAANEQTKWISAIEKAKKRYENARAAKGSTLDFFDDDLTASASALVTSIASTVSPIADRRSIVSDDSRLYPSSVNKDDLRCRSTEAVTRPYQKPEYVASESHVKRSFSDPKAGISYSVRERSSSKQRSRPRPRSLVNISDHDIATWVLTNENRNQSGSITSDISDDSQRSSGIGDSFRSINSDIGLQMTFSHLPEVSKVAQLKARFESHGCDSPVNTECSDSSLSAPSILGFPETSPALASSRRISPPDYMDEHLTIKEEENSYTNNDRISMVLTSITDSDKDTENDSSESLRTINNGGSTLRLSNRSYENIDIVKMPIKLNYVNTASQTETEFSIYGLDSLPDNVETGVRCHLLLGNHPSDHLEKDFEIETFNEHIELHTQNKNKNITQNYNNDNLSENLTEVLVTEGLTNVTVTENLRGVDVTEHLAEVNVSQSLTDVDISENVMTVDYENVSDFTENWDVISEISSIPCEVSDLMSSKFSDAATQCDEGLLQKELKTDVCKSSSVTTQSTMTEELKSFTDTSTQYEALCCKDTSTQCGDFIQLAGVNDKEDGAKNPRVPKLKTCESRNFDINVTQRPPLYKNSLSDEGSSTRSISPFMDMLTQSSRPHSALLHRRQGCTLKHSHSEANIPLATAISHGRSRSDEPQQSSLQNSPEYKHRNSAPTKEFPGMRALQSLSESLESSLQHRLDTPCNSKPIVKHYEEDGCVKFDTSKNNSSNLTKPILVRHNSSSSTALRRLAIMNNSPLITKKEVNESGDNEEELEIDSFNEDILTHGPTNQSSPKLRSRIQFDESGNTAETNSKRFTWHDFDSLSALKRIEQTKYGPTGRAHTLPLTKSMSKSTEIISSSKKTSLKRSLIKRFTNVLNRSDESRSSLHASNSKDIGDDKSLKRKEKKERKRREKEKRAKEKEEKKQKENSTKTRSSSVSSANSHINVPLSSTNSYGSFGSHTSSVNSR